MLDNLQQNNCKHEYNATKQVSYIIIHKQLHKSNSITDLDRPIGFWKVEALSFQDNRYMKVVRLSALRTGCLTPQEIPGTHFCYRLSQLQGHSVARRIMSMKNSNDTIENRTRDLPACSTVLQLTVPPHTT